MQSTPHGTGGNRVDIPLSESEYQTSLRTCSGRNSPVSFHGLLSFFAENTSGTAGAREEKKGLQGAAISLIPNDVMARAMRVVSHRTV